MKEKKIFYGFSKIIFKSEIIAWFSDLGISSGPDNRGMDGFQEWLKDGTILCALINTLAPGTVKKIHNTKTVKMQVSCSSLIE